MCFINSRYQLILKSGTGCLATVFKSESVESFSKQNGDDFDKLMCTLFTHSILTVILFNDCNMKVIQDHVLWFCYQMHSEVIGVVRDQYAKERILSFLVI